MLVSIDDLISRLPFTMDADETREANGALEDLSFDAQSIGSARWTTAANTPQSVQNLILRAAARHMKNYEGYTVSRAGDETVQWAESETPGTATFTAEEKRMLAQMGGRGSFIGTVNVIAYQSANRPIVGTVPTEQGDDFPLFADPVEPW